MAYEAKPRLSHEIDPAVINRMIKEKYTDPLRQKIFGPDETLPAAANTDNQKPDESSRSTKDTKPMNVNSPLVDYSLRGLGELFESKAVNAKPLLGEICMAGQSTVLYAQPNTGKTLITLHLIQQAVRENLIQPDNVFYVNADDSSDGLANKMRLLDDIGVHTLAPGFRNFSAVGFLNTLRVAAETDKARDTLVVIDTMKKFTNLMDKKLSSDAANICRQYTMRGGSILALAHTTKNGDVNGNPRYAGTTDILEDFDAAYIISPIKTHNQDEDTIASFKNIKRRGDNPETAGYAYTARAGISYDQRLASVRAVDPTQLEQFTVIERRVADDIIIEAIRDSIKAGEGDGKMRLIRAAAERCGASERKVIAVVERHGETPEQLWTFKSGNRGVRNYVLIEG